MVVRSRPSFFQVLWMIFQERFLKPKSEIGFERVEVKSGNRKLGARWSVKLEQELKMMHGIDIEQELTNTLATHLQQEIDRETLRRALENGKATS